MSGGEWNGRIEKEIASTVFLREGAEVRTNDKT